MAYAKPYKNSPAKFKSYFSVYCCYYDCFILFFCQPKHGLISVFVNVTIVIVYKKNNNKIK